MVSACNGNLKLDIVECNGKKAKGDKDLHISTSRRTLLSDGNSQRSSPLSTTASTPTSASKIQILKFGSASARFRRLAEEREKVSQSVTSATGHHIIERLNGVLSKKIDWNSVRKMSKEWIRDPINMALFGWITVVAVSGAILFLVMTGMLNHAIPKKSHRDTWFEVNNQILNALFTLMCLYQHPKRIHHLILLCRWKPEDVTRLRQMYCKNGTYKPHEWTHIMVVVILLHVNCFAQYALCGLNLGYRRANRPAMGVAICISVAIAAPAIAGLYSIVSPLGKDYSQRDEEGQGQDCSSEKQVQLSLRSHERRYSFASRDDQRVVVDRPEWSGGILDFWDDISLAYLSLFCSFCVFGWNMERLNFGNMYVHIATFLLFCMAPFWIFLLAAVNIQNDNVRGAMAGTGIVLCVFGLLYGGFWRIQMRKRFNLPAYNFCFGQPAASDCSLWLFCCWCSLAQEVRTRDAYDMVEDKFCLKQIDQGGHFRDSSPCEDGAAQRRSGASTPLGTISSPSKMSPYRGCSSPNIELASLREEYFIGVEDETMVPPAPASIQRVEPLDRDKVEIIVFFQDIWDSSTDLYFV